MPSDFKPPKRIKDPAALKRFRLMHIGEICEGCSERPGIAAHHAKFRSRRGDDVESNLRWLCQICHDAEHGIRTLTY